MQVRCESTVHWQSWLFRKSGSQRAINYMLECYFTQISEISIISIVLAGLTTVYHEFDDEIPEEGDYNLRYFEGK